MRRDRESSRGSRIVAGAVVLICAVALAASALSPGTDPRQGNRPEVRNKTQAFQVVSVEQIDGDYVLTLRNGSGKDLNGYAIGFGAPGSKVFVELTTSERVLAPGETAEERIPAANLRAGADALRQPEITILAVIFEDRTSDGDPQTIAEIEQHRLGVKMQLKRVLPLIEALLNSSNSDTQAALDRLKAQISSLSERPGGDLPRRVGTGLRSVKEDLLMEIHLFEQAQMTPRQGLARVKEKAKRVMAKL